MWDSEMITSIRFVIGDLACPPKYSDESLRKLLLVSGQFTQQENSFIQNYTINIDNQTITPDPTNPSGTGTRDDGFINLTILKAACFLARGSLPSGSRQHVFVKEGNYQFDGRNRLVAEQYIEQSWCQAYADAKYEFSVLHSVEFGKALIWRACNPGSCC